jgi:hypothetical protein
MKKEIIYNFNFFAVVAIVEIEATDSELMDIVPLG